MGGNNLSFIEVKVQNGLFPIKGSVLIVIKITAFALLGFYPRPIQAHKQKLQIQEDSCSKRLETTKCSSLGNLLNKQIHQHNGIQ